MMKPTVGAERWAEQQVEVDGLRIAYRRQGKGPPLVFLHGFFGDSRVWRRQFELADDYTVVAWDTPGCGGSSTPPKDFRMPDYAGTLAGFITEVGLDRPHLVGNSFGGTLALEVAVHFPELIRSVVAAGGYAGWSGSLPPGVVVERLSGCLADLELPPDQVVTKWTPGFVTPAAPRSVIDELAGIISEFRPDGMAVMIRALAEADLRDGLPSITAPVLLVGGDQDVRSSLSVAEDLYERIPGSRLVVIEGAGHLAQVEAPEAFNTQIRGFVGSVAP